jgi:ATP-dependent helicase Lhr and Lhr-like helicase
MAEGRSGLLHATTGSGKTLAVAFGAWLAASETADVDDAIRVLWITPMRALAADTERSLREAFAGVGQDALGSPAWRIGARTGDTSSSERAALVKKPPRLLVTTPESLTLMLTQERARETFGSLAFVIVDEWHELLGNKRGVQTQLALARLRHFRSNLATWGLSATLGNLEEARRVLLGPRDAARGALVEGRLDKPLIIDTLLPKAPERFPWAGHLGAKMVERSSQRSKPRQRRSFSPTPGLRRSSGINTFFVCDRNGPESSPSITVRCRVRHETGSSKGSRLGR